MLDDLISALIVSLTFGDSKKRRREEQGQAAGWGPAPMSRRMRIFLGVIWGAACLMLTIYLHDKFSGH